MWFAALVALFVATPSFATPTELDKKTVASKAYVDTKQDKIETGLVEFDDLGTTAAVPALVLTNAAGTALNGNTIGFLDLNTYNNLDSGLDELPDTMVPSIGLLRILNEDIWNHMPNWTPLTWNNTQSTAINAYNSTFGNGTNQWAGDSSHLINGQFLANSLALKQNKITTGLVEFEGDDATINVPSVVTTNAAGTDLTGNQIGFMTLSAFSPTASPFLDFKDRDDGDSFVPSAALVAEGLAQKQSILPAAWTNITNPNLMASTGGQTIDLTTIRGVVGRRYITAGGAQPLTKKSGADNVILYINGTKTLAQYQTSNFGATGGIATTTTYENYIKGALVSLELLKDVYSELNAKITNNALPTGTTGTVVTYNGTNAQTGVQEFGERAVYDPANAYNASTDATKLATMASVKYECAGYEAGHENDPDYCWLWALPN